MAVSNQLDSNDITRNLPTLQFIHALTEEEKNLMILRKRSHALTVAACANATYAVQILNETRFGTGFVLFSQLNLVRNMIKAYVTTLQWIGWCEIFSP